MRFTDADITKFKPLKYNYTYYMVQPQVNLFFVDFMMGLNMAQFVGYVNIEAFGNRKICPLCYKFCYNADCNHNWGKF